MRLISKIFFCSCFLSLIFLLSSCNYDSVYIQPGKAVQLRESLKNVKVYIKTDKNINEPAILDIPKGWYCLPNDS